MLAFIDESGQPHPDDPTSRPVLAAVCFPNRNRGTSANHTSKRLRRSLQTDLISSSSPWR